MKDILEAILNKPENFYNYQTHEFSIEDNLFLILNNVKLSLYIDMYEFNKEQLTVLADKYKNNGHFMLRLHSHSYYEEYVIGYPSIETIEGCQAN